MSAGPAHSPLGRLTPRALAGRGAGRAGRGDGRPPAERPRGHRGPRGWAALAVAVGVIPTLYVSTRPTGGTFSGSGTTGVDPGSLSYSFTLGPGLAFELGLTALALGLAVASAILWRARRGRSIAGGSLLAAAAAAAAILLTGMADHHATPPLAAVNALAIGTPRAVVLSRLGAPEATAQTTSTGPGLDPVCVVYPVGQAGPPPQGVAVLVPAGEPDWIGPGVDHVVLCFTRGRLAVKAPV